MLGIHNALFQFTLKGSKTSTVRLVNYEPLLDDCCNSFAFLPRNTPPVLIMYISFSQSFVLGFERGATRPFVGDLCTVLHHLYYVFKILNLLITLHQTRQLDAIVAISLLKYIFKTIYFRCSVPFYPYKTGTSCVTLPVSSTVYVASTLQRLSSGAKQLLTIWNAPGQ